MNIVILHGWGQEGSTFYALCDQLQSLPHVESAKALDLPGFGTQKLLNSGWGIPEYAQWVDGQIREFKTKDVVIFGHSFGGRIGAYLASQKPAYLSALILSGAPLLYRPSKKIQLKNRIFKSMKALVPKKYKPALYSQELKEAEKAGLGEVFRKVVKFDQTKYLPLIKVPTLLIWGDHDTEAPIRIAKEAHTLIPKSRLSIVKNSGHSSFYSHPYIFVSYVKEFLNNL